MTSEYLPSGLSNQLDSDTGEPAKKCTWLAVNLNTHANLEMDH